MEMFFNKTKEAKENITKRCYQACSCDNMHMLVLAYKTADRKDPPKWTNIPSTTFVKYIVAREVQ